MRIFIAHMKLTYTQAGLPAELESKGNIVVFSHKGDPIMYFENGGLVYDSTIDRSLVLSFCARHKLQVHQVTIVPVNKESLNMLHVLRV